MKVPTLRNLLVLIFFAGMAIGPVHAQERIWRVCISDASVPPLLNNDPANPGLAEKVLTEAGRQVGLETILLRYPSPRCRALMLSDQLDAILVAPSAANLADFQFPRKAGSVDAGRRLVRISLVWVKRADTPYDWNQGQLVGASPASLVVGSRAARTAASEPLLALGFHVDSSANSTHQMLQKLAARRVDLGLAIQEEVAAAMRDPQLQNLVVLSQSLSSVDYFVAVHQQLPPEVQAKVEAWWTAISHLRDSPEYRLR